MSIVIGLALALVVAALAAAGVFMIRGASPGARRDRMAKALTVRIAVSVALFVCILLAWRFGWIHPAGVPAGR